MVHVSQAHEQAGAVGAVPPRTPYEEAVAAIWRDILGRPDVGALDDFFSLDATSLQAIQVVSRIRKTLGVDIPVKDVFQEPTVAALAARVQAESASRRSALTRRPADAEPALSFDQERLWLESQLLPPTAYNVHGRRRLAGPVDVAALETGVAAIVARHDALRARFPVIDGQPVQIVDPPDAQWRLETARADSLAAALRLADRQAETAFDLALGPLFRCLLVAVADGTGGATDAEPEYVLSVTVHHIVADAWSIGLFVRELLALYAVGGDPERAGLPELTVQYPDFAVWQRAHIAGEELTGQLAYWRAHLAGAPPVLAMPVSRRLAVPGGGIERARAELTGAESAALGDLRRKHGVTSFMVLLAALGATLGRWSGRRDVVVGVPIAGRADAGTHALIGFFVNTLPVRVDLRGDPSFGDLLARVRQAALDGYANADAPFDVLVKELQAPRDPRQTPLFQVLLNVIGPPEAETVAGIAVEPLELPALPSKFDLALTAQERDGRLGFDLAFNADRYHGSMMRALLAQVVALVRDALEDPGRAVSELGGVSGAAADSSGSSDSSDASDPADSVDSVDGNATAAGWTPHLAVDRFARQTDRVAVVGADGEHGYRWLARAADRVAAFLGAQEAEPGRVGIARHPTAAFVATVLGCLKAGLEFTVTEPAAGVPASFLGLSQLLDTEESDGLSTLFDDINEPLPAAESEATAHESDDWAVARFGFSRDDRFAAPATSPGLLVSALSSALSAGATLVMTELTPADGVAELADWLRSQVVSVLYTAPPLIRALAAADLHLPTLRFALVDNTGDFLPHDVEAAALLSPDCRCVSVYRVGQDGRPLAVYAVPGDFTVASAPLRVPLGTGAVVLPHPSGRPVAIGEIVEIRADGRRTGDLGRWRADGVLEYTGLAGADPGQDLAEAASALRDVAEVRDALVTEQVGDEGDAIVVAYLVGPDPDAGTSGIRRYLISRLPEWLIPGALVVVDALPLTAEGDHDLALLPRTDPGAATEVYVAPRTPMEQQLVDVMAALLAVDRIGVHDTFFELGGFSLLATRLTSRIRDLFDVELSLRDVFEAPTVEGLAQLILRAQSEAFGGEELEGLLAEITAAD